MALMMSPLTYILSDGLEILQKTCGFLQKGQLIVTGTLLTDREELAAGIVFTDSVNSASAGRRPVFVYFVYFVVPSAVL